MADLDVRRWPLTEIASAPASHSPLTTIWRSLEKTLPSSLSASVRGLPSALVSSLPGALSSSTVMPGPVTLSAPEARVSAASRVWSEVSSWPSAWACRRSTSACSARSWTSWRSTWARRLSIWLTRLALALIADVDGVRRASAPRVSRRPVTTAATITVGVRVPVLGGRPAASRSAAAAAYPGSRGRSIIEVSSVIDSSGRRPAGVTGGPGSRCEVGGVLMSPAPCGRPPPAGPARCT